MSTVNKATKAPKVTKENHNFTKKTVGEYIVFSIVFVIFAAYALTLIVPLLWLVMTSLKDRPQYMMDILEYKPFALPERWNFSNYVKVFTAIEYKDTNLLGMAINSVWYILFSTLPSIFCSTLFAYVMAKYNFRFKEFVYGLYLFTLTLPLVGTGGAYFVMIRDLNLYDSPLYPIMVNLYCFSGHFLYMFACFKNISWSYAEAVFIDGGNHYTVFFRIMLPQAMPVASTLFLTAAISQWNVYTDVMMYLPSYPTIASGLFEAADKLQRESPTYYFTGLVLSTVPILTLFIVFSDKLMKNLSIGGLKG